MNILIYTSYSHYSNCNVGGAEISLELIATLLAKAGDQVYFATLDKTIGPAILQEKIGPLMIYRFKHPPYLKNNARSQKIHRFIADIVRSNNIELVHCYEIKDTYEVLKAKEKYKLNIKIVQRISGLLWTHRLDTKITTKAHVEWVFNSVDAIDHLTPFFKKLVLQKIREYGIPFAPKKQINLDIGIDLNLFQYQWEPKINKTFRIICIAKFEAYQKRQDLLIKALSRIKQNFKIEFFGTGPTLPYYQKLCHQNGMAKKTIFHGYVKQKEIAATLAKADLFVLPTDFEGLPKALLEAMAVGVPSLISDVMPLNCYVQDGKNGFLTKNTQQEWTNKLNFLMGRPKNLLKISRSARIFIERNFNAMDNIKKYRKEFQKIISL